MSNNTRISTRDTEGGTAIIGVTSVTISQCYCLVWSSRSLHGGSTLGITGADFAILAGDTRSTSGYNINSRMVPKVSSRSLRVKRVLFDISGCWLREGVSDSPRVVTHEPLGITGADFAILAGDTRSTSGYNINSRMVPKVFKCSLMWNGCRRRG
jgi:hypothetical protein